MASSLSKPQAPTKLPEPRALLAEARALAGGKPVLLTFDFDGTLVRLVQHPDDVRLDPSVSRALADVASKLPFAFCTGRAVGDLMKFLEPGIAASVLGNHGIDWRLADGSFHDGRPAGWREWHPRMIRALELMTAAQGGRIEDKRGSIALHFREAEWWRSEAARRWLEQQLGEAADLLEGVACWNLLPRGQSKGRALVEFCRERGYGALAYFGDEPTDETVFAQASDFPVIGVKVGEGQTQARYRARDVEDVHRWVLALQLSMVDSGLM